MNEVNVSKENKFGIVLGCFFVGMSVVLGAFGAHGLKKILDEAHLATFKTGVHYQMIHGLALFAIISAKNILAPQKSFKSVIYLFTIGVLLFSVNCYIYALTSVKTFAMIVPLGGTAFIIGWIIFAVKAFRS
jgi:uncharacterized membrane protein YgdD (TMEM256/DUF423 family)